MALWQIKNYKPLCTFFGSFNFVFLIKAPVLRLTVLRNLVIASYTAAEFTCSIFLYDLLMKTLQVVEGMIGYFCLS